MYDVFENTPEDKDQCILDCIERNCTYKETMRECHVSPNTITEVRAKYGYKEHNSLKLDNQKSKETQALKLFSDGKKPLKVAIELDIATDFVFSIYQNFQCLRNLEFFISCFEHVNGNIEPFLHLFDLMNTLGMTTEQVAEQVKHGYNLPYLSNSCSTLSKEVHNMKSQKQSLEIYLNFMQNQTEECFKSLQYFNNEIEIKNSELVALNYEINQKRNLVQNLDNEDGYVRVMEATKKQTRLIMQDFSLTSVVTLSATLEAIRRYPDNQMLF